MRVIKYFSLSFALVFLLIPFGSIRAAGVPGTGALVAPTYAEYSVKAGGQLNGKLLVRNEGQNSTDYTISAEGVTIKDEIYERNYSFTTNPEGLETWTKLDRSKFTLSPGEQINISYAIAVPQNASAGTHTADILVSTANNKPDAAGIRSVKRVGSHLYVTVDGLLSKQGKVDYFHASGWQNGAPLQASLRMLNTGNVHYFANVNYVITDFFGNEKYRFSNSLVVLPNAPRMIALTWDKSPSFGFFKLGGTVHYFDKTEILPTRYVLVLSPVAFLLMLVAIGALVAYAIWSRPKNVRRR